MERSKRISHLILIAVLAVIVALTFSVSQASAASKSMKMIQEDGWKYNSKGLITRVQMYNIASTFKYDKKGNVTKITRYAVDGKKKYKINEFKFTYSKKGKLKSVRFIGYQDGKVTQRSDGAFKLTKKGQLKQLRIETYGGNDGEYKWSYNKHGQVKGFRWMDYEAGRLVNKAVMKISRKSNGVVKKMTTNGYYKMNGQVYPFKMTDKYTTKMKSGYIKMLRASASGFKEEHVFKYKSKKIPEKWLDKVEAQQLDLHYYIMSDGWNFIDPFLYLAI